MSLKAFHIVFIAASIGLSFGLGVWCLKAYADEGEQSSLIWSLVSFAAGLAFHSRLIFLSFFKTIQP